MASPTGRTNKRLVRDTKRGGELLEEFSAAARKIHSGFDKLNKRQQRHIVTQLSLQRFEPDNSEYSNKNIKNKMLSYLGVASGEYDDTNVVGKDSAGRPKRMYEQKSKNPSGFAYGGAVHRGRKAMRGSD